MKNSEKAMDSLKNQAQNLDTIKGGKHSRSHDVLNDSQEREFGGDGPQAGFQKNLTVEKQKGNDLK